MVVSLRGLFFFSFSLYLLADRNINDQSQFLLGNSFKFFRGHLKTKHSQLPFDSTEFDDLSQSLVYAVHGDTSLFSISEKLQKNELNFIDLEISQQCELSNSEKVREYLIEQLKNKNLKFEELPRSIKLKLLQNKKFKEFICSQIDNGFINFDHLDQDVQVEFNVNYDFLSQKVINRKLDFNKLHYSVQKTLILNYPELKKFVIEGIKKGSIKIDQFVPEVQDRVYEPILDTYLLDAASKNEIKFDKLNWKIQTKLAKGSSLEFCKYIIQNIKNGYKFEKLPDWVKADLEKSSRFKNQLISSLENKSLKFSDLDNFLKFYLKDDPRFQKYIEGEILAGNLNFGKVNPQLQLLLLDSNNIKLYVLKNIENNSLDFFNLALQVQQKIAKEDCIEFHNFIINYIEGNKNFSSLPSWLKYQLLLSNKFKETLFNWLKNKAFNIERVSSLIEVLKNYPPFQAYIVNEIVNQDLKFESDFHFKIQNGLDKESYYVRRCWDNRINFYDLDKDIQDILLDKAVIQDYFGKELQSGALEFDGLREKIQRTLVKSSSPEFCKYVIQNIKNGHKFEKLPNWAKADLKKSPEFKNQLISSLENSSLKFDDLGDYLEFYLKNDSRFQKYLERETLAGNLNFGKMNPQLQLLLWNNNKIQLYVLKSIENGTLSFFNLCNEVQQKIAQEDRIEFHNVIINYIEGDKNFSSLPSWLKYQLLLSNKFKEILFNWLKNKAFDIRKVNSLAEILKDYPPFQTYMVNEIVNQDLKIESELSLELQYVLVNKESIQSYYVKRFNDKKLNFKDLGKDIQDILLDKTIIQDYFAKELQNGALEFDKLNDKIKRILARNSSSEFCKYTIQNIKNGHKFEKLPNWLKTDLEKSPEFKNQLISSLENGYLKFNDLDNFLEFCLKDNQRFQRYTADRVVNGEVKFDKLNFNLQISIISQSLIQNYFVEKFKDKSLNFYDLNVDIQDNLLNQTIVQDHFAKELQTGTLEFDRLNIKIQQKLARGPSPEFCKFMIQSIKDKHKFTFPEWLKKDLSRSNEFKKQFIAELNNKSIDCNIIFAEKWIQRSLSDKLAFQKYILGKILNREIEINQLEHKLQANLLERDLLQEFYIKQLKADPLGFNRLSLFVKDKLSDQKSIQNFLITQILDGKLKMEELDNWLMGKLLLNKNYQDSILSNINNQTFEKLNNDVKITLLKENKKAQQRVSIKNGQSYAHYSQSQYSKGNGGKIYNLIKKCLILESGLKNKYLVCYNAQRREYGVLGDFFVALVKKLYQLGYIKEELPNNFHVIQYRNGFLVRNYEMDKKIYKKEKEILQYLMKGRSGGVRDHSLMSANLFITGNETNSGSYTIGYFERNNNVKSFDVDLVLKEMGRSLKVNIKSAGSELLSLFKLSNSIFNSGRLLVIFIPLDRCNNWAYLAQPGAYRVIRQTNAGKSIRKVSRFISYAAQGQLGYTTMDLGSEIAVPATLASILNPYSGVRVIAFDGYQDGLNQNKYQEYLKRIDKLATKTAYEIINKKGGKKYHLCCKSIMEDYRNAATA